MIAIALQNIASDYKYRGSLTEDNKQAFDALIDLGGTKPSWGAIQSEIASQHGRDTAEEAQRQQDNKNKAWETLVIDEFFNMLKTVHAGGTPPTFEQFIGSLPHQGD